MLYGFSKSSLCRMLEIFDYSVILPFMTTDLGTQKKFSWSFFRVSLYGYTNSKSMHNNTFVYINKGYKNMRGRISNRYLEWGSLPSFSFLIFLSDSSIILNPLSGSSRRCMPMTSSKGYARIENEQCCLGPNRLDNLK